MNNSQRNSCSNSSCVSSPLISIAQALLLDSPYNLRLVGPLPNSHDRKVVDRTKVSSAPKARHSKRCRPCGPSRLLQTIPTTPLRTWLFHDGPSGLLQQIHVRRQ